MSKLAQSVQQAVDDLRAKAVARKAERKKKRALRRGETREPKKQ
jgi:hypothetical protein